MSYRPLPPGYTVDLEEEESAQSLYGPRNVDLPGQTAEPIPKMVFGDPKDVPGLISVGTINLNELRGAYQGAGRPMVVGEEGEFAVIPKGSPGDYFGIFKDAASAEDYAKKIEESEILTNEALSTRQYPTEYSHQVPLTGYAKDLLERQRTGTVQPLRPDQQIHGPMGEAPRPMTKKERTLSNAKWLSSGGPPPKEGEAEEEEEEPQYESGLASQFGAIDINNPNESHVGAWNNDITSPNVAGVALPASTLAKHFGDPKSAYGALVEVRNSDTGKTGVFPIVDIGPADWVKKSQGPTIDLTAGAVQQLGHSGGLDKAEWKVLGHAKPLPEGYKVDESAAPSEQPATAEQPLDLKPLPKGYVVDEGLKIVNAIDPKAPYMSRPRDTNRITQIVVHGNEETDVNSLIEYGRHVDPTRGKGGFDPGYHYYVARDGTVYQGAPDDRVAYHVRGKNSNAIGVTFVGADNGVMPTPEQEKAGEQLISQLGIKYNIDPKNVHGHGEIQSDRDEREGGNIAKNIREHGYIGAPDQRENELKPLPKGYTVDEKSVAPLEPASKVPLGERQLSDQELVEVRGAQPVGAPETRRPELANVRGAQPVGEPEVRKTEAELPRMSALEADRLGLERWRDFESGMEIRRGHPTEVGAFEAVQQEQLAQPPAVQIPTDIGIPGAARHNLGEPPKRVPGVPVEQRAIKDPVNQVIRGVSETYLGAAEGLYRMAAEGATKGSLAEKVFAPAGLKAEQVAKMRQTVKDTFPVTDELANSMTGNIITGLAQLSGIPAYMIPGVGPVAGTAMTMGQLYDEGRQDYKQTQEKLGKPFDPVEAHNAAVKYMGGASPLEIGPDLLLARVFKPLVGKVKVGDIQKGLSSLKALGVGALEGTTEAAQQAWLNTVAKWWEGYDPDRPFTQDVLESGIVGGVVGLVGGGVAKAGGEARGAPVQPSEETRAQVTAPSIATAAQEGRTEGIKEKLAPAEPTKEAVTAPVIEKETVASISDTYAKHATEALAGRTVVSDKRAEYAHEAAIDATLSEVPDEHKEAFERAAAVIPRNILKQSPEVQKAWWSEALEATAKPTKAAEKPTILKDFSQIPPDIGAKPATAAPTITGKTVGEIAPRDITNDRKGYAAKRTAEGATPEQIAEELRAEEDKVRGQIDSALPVGSQVRQEGGLYQLDSDGTWKSADEKASGVLRAPDPEAEIVRVGSKGETIPATAEEEGPTTEADIEALRQKYRAEIEGKPGIGPTTAGVLDFEDDTTATPERQAGIARIESDLATHPQSGRSYKLVPVSPKADKSKGSQKLVATIQGLEKALGKKIQFVRSGTGETLPFSGLTDPSDPNTVFLDADGDRNVLALVGHEWGHTLKVTNPQLHGQLVEQIKPLVKEWEQQKGQLRKEGYLEKHTEEELASNHIGDAFTRPDFWKQLNKKNPSLFKRAVKTVNDFFKSLIAKARGSEWGTEEFVSDLKAMHKVIADAVNQAVTKGPEPKPAGLKEAMEGVKGEKLKEKMGGVIKPAASNQLPVKPSPDLMFATRKMAKTDAFKKWFGESKVVDKNGEPRIVYHGTNANFDIFNKGDIGFHFGTAEAANDRLAAAHDMIEDWRVMGDAHPGYNILPVYLRIENPVRLPDLGSWHPATVAQELKDRGVFTPTDIVEIADSGWDKDQANPVIIKKLAEKGYDGIVYRNVGEGRRKLVPGEIKERQLEVKPTYPGATGPMADKSVSVYDKETNTLLAVGSTEKEARKLARDALETKTHAFDDSYIIFKPTQAKSAIGNIGTFDISRPEVQFATRKKKPAPSAPAPAQAKPEPIVIRRAVKGRYEKTPSLKKGEEGKETYLKGDIHRTYESVPDTLRKSNAPELARAIEQYVDDQAAYMGKWGNKAYKALPLWMRVKKYTPIELIREADKRAWDTVRRLVRMKTRAAHMSKEEEEFSNYIETEQKHGTAAADKLGISPAARKMVDTIHEIFDEAGTEAERLKVMNKNPNTGKWELFKKREDPGRRYFPHILRKDIRQAIQNGAMDVVAKEELKQAMVDEGIIPPGSDDSVFTKHLDNYMARDRENGFMGSLEHKRSRDFPHSAYDYSYATALDYIKGASDRMAQIKAFGQGKGGKAVAPEGTLFDSEIKRAGNDYAREYIELVRDVVFGGRKLDPVWRGVAGLRNLGVVTQLGTLRFTVRNLTYGIWHNYASVRGLPGVAEAKFLWSLPMTFREIKDGYERGNFMHDIMNVQHDGEVSGSWAQTTGKAAGVSLRSVAAKAVETAVRGNTLAIARMNLRRAIKVYGKNPKSYESRQFIGWLKRLGFEGTEAHDLIVEGGKGPLFNRYMRRTANRIQAGYSIADSPLVLNTPEGKAALQYSKWSVEQTNRFAKDIVNPLVRALSLGQFKKETVQIINKDGTKETVPVPGEILTALRYTLGLALGGASGEWLLEKLLGVAPQTVRLANVMKTWREDKWAGFLQGLSKFSANAMQAGFGGYAIANVGQEGWDIVEKSRYKDPFSMPFVQPLKNMRDAALNLFDEKNFTPEHLKRRLDEFIETTVGGYRDVKNVAAEINDVFHGDFRAMTSQYRAIQVSKVRSLVRKYENERGDVEKTRHEGRFGKTEKSPFRDAFHEDLVMGDTDAAKERMDREFDDMSLDRRKMELESLKQSMRSKLPIKVGTGSKEELSMFKKWAEENASPSEQDMIENIDSEYKAAARTVLGIEFEKATPKSLQEYMRKMDLKNEPTNPPTWFPVLWQR